MISPDEAFQKISKLMPDRKTDYLSLEKSYDKIIAEDIYAGIDIPPYTGSYFDGYAICSHDTIGVSADEPVQLTVIGTLAAGDTYKDINPKSVEKTAIKVMTGSIIPGKYDAVVPWEQVTVSNGGEKILIYQEISKGQNIAPQGEEISQGDRVISCDERLSFHDIDMLASLGITDLLVYQPYKIGLLITGSELIPAEQKLMTAKIHSSNNYMLKAALQSIGHSVLDFGIVTDEKNCLKDEIEKSCEQVDLLITTGGVSKGDYDLIPEVLNEMGAERVFWQINMRPGTFTHVSRYKKTPVVSLSGKPAASLTVFQLLLSPVLTAQSGINSISDTAFYALLYNDINRNETSKWKFRWGYSWVGDEGRCYCVSLNKSKFSALDLTKKVGGYLAIPPHSKDLNSGELVQFIPVEK